MSPTLLITVVGPTAIGKTRWAVSLAKHYNTEVISADSRQFFKEMSIGTAAPTVEEQDNVPHHFVHHLSVEQPYSVGDFEQDALNLIAERSADHSVLIMAGGSGLYVDAVLYGLDHFPEVEAGIREDLVRTLDNEGLAALQTELQRTDPEYYKQVDLQNPQRIIRALEVIRSSGQPFSSFRKRAKDERPFASVLIGLKADREVIYERINQRVDQMMEQGLEKEARALYPLRELNALQTVGYKELFAYFDGEISREMAVDRIKQNTRRFAKRQLTWFRKNKDIKWFDHDSSLEEVVGFIEQYRGGLGD